MNSVLLLMIGGIIGIIDIIPMIKNKLDYFSIGSAFFFHLIMPFIVNGNAWNLPMWLKGSILYFLLAVPMMILVAKDDKKSPIIMGVSSIVFGAISGLLMNLM